MWRLSSYIYNIYNIYVSCLSAYLPLNWSTFPHGRQWCIGISVYICRMEGRKQASPVTRMNRREIKSPLSDSKTRISTMRVYSYILSMRRGYIHWRTFMHDCISYHITNNTTQYICIYLDMGHGFELAWENFAAPVLLLFCTQICHIFPLVFVFFLQFLFDSVPQNGSLRRPVCRRISPKNGQLKIFHVVTFCCFSQSLHPLRFLAGQYICTQNRMFWILHGDFLSLSVSLLCACIVA